MYSQPSQNSLNIKNLVHAKRTISRWNKRDKWSVGVVLLGLIALHFTPILSSAGVPIAVLITTVAVFNPSAALLYIAGSQIAPDPPNAPFTLAQLFVLLWVLTLPFNGCRHHLKAIGKGFHYAIWFLLWWFFIRYLNGTLQISWVYAFITGAIVFTYADRERDLIRLVWMLVLGTGLAAIGYWGTTLSLPVEGKVYEHILRGGLRMGSGRGDVNTTAQNLGFFLYSGLAVLISRAAIASFKQRRELFFKAGALIVATVPALISTGSRGGIGYLVLGGIATCYYILTIKKLIRTSSKVLYLLVASFMLAAISWTFILETSLGKMLTATLEYNQEQAFKNKSSALIAGRSEIWTRYFDMIATHPVTGVSKGEFVNMGEYGSGYLGVDDLSGGTGHNVFLDMAAGAGIPGVLLFMFLFSMPIIDLLMRKDKIYAMPFIIAHVMVFLVFNNLSVGNWKTYWALFAITVIACSRNRKSKTTVKNLHA